MSGNKLIAEIAAQLVEGPQAARFAALFFVTFKGSELDARAPRGLLRGHAGTRQFGGAGLQVEAQLIVHVALESGSSG